MVQPEVIRKGHEGSDVGFGHQPIAATDGHQVQAQAAGSASMGPPPNYASAVTNVQAQPSTTVSRPADTSGSGS
jgi:hypothetical protein